MRKYIYHTLVIVTLTLGHVGLCSESDRIPKTIISSSNINTKTETKMYSIRDIYTKKLQGIQSLIKIRSNYLQNVMHETPGSKWKAIENFGVSEKLELNITRNNNWDQEPRHISKQLKADIKSDNLPLHTDKLQNIQRNCNNIKPQANNISSILDTVRNYHELIGIPSANKIKQIKQKCKKGNSKSECRLGVVGGTVAKIGDFPYAAGLIIALVSGHDSICGASLVSNNRLVTAAHCWFDMNNRANMFFVILGAMKLDYMDNTKIPTTDVVVHPKYNAKTPQHDIAIIRLKDKVTLSKKIQLINLPSGELEKSTFENNEAYIVGYGLSDLKNINFGNVIQRYKKAKVVATKQCEKYAGHLGATVICTSGGNACIGDSGGPLSFNSRNKYYLIGVVSFGSPQCDSNIPSGFTRVTSYLQWIKSRL